MASTQIELNPVKSITTGFIGQPGKRVFYIQAHGDGEEVTLIVEKQQVEALANGIDQVLEGLRGKVPHARVPTQSASAIALGPPSRCRATPAPLWGGPPGLLRQQPSMSSAV